MVYQPEEDSHLLEKEVRSYIENTEDKNSRVLDMGSGSGFQALACIKAGIKKSNILCADIDSEAIKHLKNLKLKTRKTNLFSNIKKKFDLIIFNPPYLPEDKYDKGLDTTAGKKGYEIIIRFLKQAKSHLKKQAGILLLISSLSRPEFINSKAKKLGYKIKKLSDKKLFFERLEVWELRK
jgi:release factor glutamine methyltransferase